MGWRRPLLPSVVALAALHLTGLQLTGCAANSEAGERNGKTAALAVQPWEIDPYTHTDQIIVDGAVVGYLVTYDALPDGSGIERVFPAGGRRILDTRFEDIGYVSPRGLFGRLGRKGAVDELGHHELNAGLARFFGGAMQATLIAFTAPEKRAAPMAAGDGAEGDAAAEGDAGGGESDAAADEG
jgi:hypothetical protein